MEATFSINGKVFFAKSSTVPISTSLNTFIRNHAKLSGTKFMCLEGGCGACIVTLRGIHPATRAHTTWAVNSVNIISAQISQSIKYFPNSASKMSTLAMDSMSSQSRESEARKMDFTKFRNVWLISTVLNVDIAVPAWS